LKKRGTAFVVVINLSGLITACFQLNIFGRGDKEEDGNGYLGEVNQYTNFDC
jgi:hypothetical protein